MIGFAQEISQPRCAHAHFLRVARHARGFVDACGRRPCDRDVSNPLERATLANTSQELTAIGVVAIGGGREIRLNLEELGEIRIELAQAIASQARRTIRLSDRAVSVAGWMVTAWLRSRISARFAIRICASRNARFSVSHDTSCCSRSSASIRRKPPFAVCSAPGRIYMKSVIIVTSNGTCSTLPSNCDSDGSASVTTGAPFAPDCRPADSLHSGGTAHSARVFFVVLASRASAWSASIWAITSWNMASRCAWLRRWT